MQICYLKFFKQFQSILGLRKCQFVVPCLQFIGKADAVLCHLVSFYSMACLIVSSCLLAIGGIHQKGKLHWEGKTVIQHICPVASGTQVLRSSK